MKISVRRESKIPSAAGRVFENNSNCVGAKSSGSSCGVASLESVVNCGKAAD